MGTYAKTGIKTIPAEMAERGAVWMLAAKSMFRMAGAGEDEYLVQGYLRRSGKSKWEGFADHDGTEITGEVAATTDAAFANLHAALSPLWSASLTVAEGSVPVQETPQEDVPQEREREEAVARERERLAAQKAERERARETVADTAKPAKVSNEVTAYAARRVMQAWRMSSAQHDAAQRLDISREDAVARIGGLMDDVREAAREADERLAGTADAVIMIMERHAGLVSGAGEFVDARRAKKLRERANVRLARLVALGV